MAYRTGYKPMGSRMPSRRQQAYAASQYDRVAAANTRRRTNAAKAVAAVSAAAGFIRNRNVNTMHTERKVIDLNRQIVAIEQTVGSPLLLNGCIAGSQNYQRIGRKIHLKSLQIRGLLLPADDTTQDQQIRMLVVYDKQANGAAPTYGDVIKSQNIAGTTSSSHMDMVNLDNRDRFEIIRDRTWAIAKRDTTATSAFSGSPTTICVEEFVRLQDRETIYNAGTAGTVGDIQSGSLYFFVISNNANASGTNFDIAFRTRFIDL